jgi:hypothetical protein
MPKAARPDFVKELGKMATNPVTGQKLQLETLIDFLIFNEEGEVDLGQGKYKSCRCQNSKDSWLLRN